MTDREVSRRNSVLGLSGEASPSSGSGSIERRSKRFGGFFETPRPRMEVSEGAVTVLTV